MISAGACYRLDVPEEPQAFLTRYGGLNRFGEPNYRLVWGWRRLVWEGGEWNDWSDDGQTFYRSASERRHVPKYFGNLERFVLEQWMPPTVYGPRSMWPRGLCDFPTRGDYEFLAKIETKAKEFAWPEVPILQYLVDGHRVSRAQREDRSLREREYLASEAKKKEAKKAGEHYEDLFRESTSAFSGVPHVSYAGLEVPRS